jgi:hypothetical protein
VGNDRQFVRKVIDLLGAHGIDAWLAGGWAEELHGMIPPREHRDIDLLYPADSFDQVDVFLRTAPVVEIEAKRFPHKRAFELDGVMVELVLIRANLVTDFWGDHPYTWPEDVFSDSSTEPRLTSVTALKHYRTHRPPARG